MRVTEREREDTILQHSGSPLEISPVANPLRDAEAGLIVRPDGHGRVQLGIGVVVEGVVSAVYRPGLCASGVFHGRDEGFADDVCVLRNCIKLGSLSW